MSGVERVREYQRRKIEEGYRKIGLVLSPEGVQALESLIAAGYAPDMTKTIHRALLQALESVNGKAHRC